MVEVDNSRLLAPDMPDAGACIERSQSSSSRAKRNVQARMSLRPSLASIRNRLSMVLTPSDAQAASTQSPNGDVNDASDPYWRPLPYNLDDSERRIIYLVKNEQDKVDLVCNDRVLYTTNLPIVHKATKQNMPDHIMLSHQARHPQARPKVDMSATLAKVKGELTVTLEGLDPITFYRAKVDCFRPVSCFTARRTADKTAWRTTTTCFAGTAASAAATVSIAYAWKNTSLVGKGGLKLVDLRDSEVLAYYAPGHGKSLGKITLQGSGLVSQRIVIATILALKYQHVMKNVATRKPEVPVKTIPMTIDGASFAETSMSETPTVCDQTPVVVVTQANAVDN